MANKNRELTRHDNTSLASPIKLTPVSHLTLKTNERQAPKQQTEFQCLRLLLPRCYVKLHLMLQPQFQTPTLQSKLLQCLRLLLPHCHAQVLHHLMLQPEHHQPPLKKETIMEEQAVSMLRKHHSVC